MDNCNGTYTATVTISTRASTLPRRARSRRRQPEFRRRRDPGVGCCGASAGFTACACTRARRRTRGFLGLDGDEPARVTIRSASPVDAFGNPGVPSSRGTICASSRKSTTCATPSSNSRRYETPPRIRRARISTPCSCPRRLVGTNSPSISTPATDRASRARRGRRRRRCSPGRRRRSTPSCPERARVSPRRSRRPSSAWSSETRTVTTRATARTSPLATPPRPDHRATHVVDGEVVPVILEARLVRRGKTDAFGRARERDVGRRTGGRVGSYEATRTGRHELVVLLRRRDFSRDGVPRDGGHHRGRERDGVRRVVSSSATARASRGGRRHGRADARGTRSSRAVRPSPSWRVPASRWPSSLVDRRDGTYLATLAPVVSGTYALAIRAAASTSTGHRSRSRWFRVSRRRPRTHVRVVGDELRVRGDAVAGEEASFASSPRTRTTTRTIEPRRLAVIRSSTR